MSGRTAECRRVLLATSALAALVLGWSGAAAAAPCVVNPATPYDNAGAINCVTFNDNANHTGDVTNDSTGTITVLGLPGQFGQQTGISVFGAGTQITGNIINNGTIVNNNIIHSGFTAINVTGTNTGSPVTIGGSVINAGTITFTLAPTLQFPAANNQAV